MSKKKLVSLSLVVIMLAIMSFGTLAWFSDKDSVENEFYVATSDSDADTADEVFSIDVWETDPATGEKTNEGVKYENILPGSVLSKNPTIKNTGYYSQYVRVYVTISDVTELKEILGITSLTEYVDLTEFFVVADDFDRTWIRNKAEDVYDVEKDTLTYVYYLNGILEKNVEKTLFTAVKIPESWTQDQMAKLNGNGDNGFTISITAEAVQTENMLETYGTIEWENAVASFDVLDKP